MITEQVKDLNSND